MISKRLKKKEIERKHIIKNKGITLIALVITIIVLLILAGVSIATLTGDNGILTKAQNAKEETQKASEKEQLQLAVMNAAMNTEKYNYETGEKDEEGKPIKVPIPAGFAPTQMEGENSVKDGLVVVDENGNEFVWIPVKEESEYERNRNYDYRPVSETAKDDTGYLPDGITIEEGKEGDKEKEIVTKAGGFYVSRYEAGKEGSNILVSKKGVTVWNNIPQEECKEKAKEFINNAEVKSGLITGIQWDVVMSIISNNKKDGKGNTFDVTVADSRRHTGNVEKSGQNEADKVYNIYDLEGNCREYVAEKNNDGTGNQYVGRGGNYDIEDHTPASYRSNSYGGVINNTSFRFVLYVM